MTSPGRSTGSKGIRRLLSLCAAFLAVVGQIALAGGMPPAEGAAASDAALVAGAICRSGLPSAEGHEAPRHRHTTCLACPICSALAYPAVLERPPAIDAQPRPSGERRIDLPAAPPLAAGAAGAPAYPTGPPRLT